MEIGPFGTCGPPLQKMAHFHVRAPHFPKYKIARNGIFVIFLIFPDSVDPNESSGMVIIKIGLLRAENLKTEIVHSKTAQNGR